MLDSSVGATYCVIVTESFACDPQQTCEIHMEGTKRRLTLKGVLLDQAGEVTYQALNAQTNAMLNVKGKPSESVRYSAAIDHHRVLRGVS